MRIKPILKELTKANIFLSQKKLIIQSFGNASCRFQDLCLIKPSGIDLNNSSSGDIVSVNIASGSYSGNLKPSSDTPTHVELYREFEDIGAIAHTHSTYATAWAQAGKPIPCLGTTHADYWNGEVPVTRDLTDEEISGDYEKETGKVIIEKIKELKVDPLDCPGILVANHGPFTWGATMEDAVKHAELLEYIAKLAWLSLSINPIAGQISSALLNKHFSRKHGTDAYYGQDSD
jgi:L-ribulose-5-phosphate 4-epimerase|tara:strand:- start:863 stop:1561 length:699 start_codon:yes stop_codon:yes gene_type:complete